MMKNKILRAYMALMLVVFGVFAMVVQAQNAEAASTSSEYTKAVATAVINCYNGGSFRNPLEMDTYKNYTGANSFIGNNTKVAVPNGYFGNNSTMSCADLVTTLLSAKSPSVAIPNKRTSSDDEIASFLGNLGYIKSSSTSTGQCISFNYYIRSNSSAGGYSSKTQQICATEINPDGTIAVEKLEILSGDSSAVQFQDAKKGSITLDCSAVLGSTGKCGKHTFETNVTKWEDFIKEIRDDLLVNNTSGIRSMLGYDYSLDVSNPMNVEPYGSATAKFTLRTGTQDNAAAYGTSFLTGSRYTSAPTFSQGEQFVLYQNYLKDYYGADITCDASETEIIALKGNGWRDVRFYGSDGQFKTCVAKATKHTGDRINGIDGSSHFTKENCNFECLTNWLYNSMVTSLPAGANIAAAGEHGFQQNSTSTGEDTSNFADALTTCKKNGAVKALGWIICPVMSWMGNSAGELYNNFVEPALRVEPQLFNEEEGDNNDTHDAWLVFQGIANVLFVILLLVVIFSQLTGVGIDNYGIKRILPKLIIAAILVNFSYYICMICVDLSNIVGNGVQGVFEGLASGLSGEVMIGSDRVATVGTGVTMTTIPIVAGLFGAVAVWANPAILLSLLVSLIGVIISIFFLFVILAAREAAIVVLVVISPLAFVCYTLPNTKNLFDKWLKMGEGLLLVYPICGLLVAGGSYVSKLLLQIGAGGGFFSAFAALLVSIVPIFFIPTVLRNSFAAMGNLGAKIAGFGDRMRSGVDRRVRSSEGYKAAQKRGYERQTRFRAGIDSKGNVTGRGAFKAKLANSRLGRLTGYQGLQAARVASAQKTREEGIQANAELADMTRRYSNSKDPTVSDEDRFTEALEKARDRGDANGMFAVIEQMRKSNMQQSKMADVTRNVLGEGQFGNMNEGQRRNFLEEFGKKYSGDFLKKDFEQANWARKGGVGVNGVSGLSGWATATATRTNADGSVTTERNIDIDDLKDEDVAALSAKNLHSLIDNGKISQSQAQRVWASNNSMDDTNRLMLGNYGTNGINMSKENAQEVLRENATAKKEGRAVDPAAMHGLTQDMVDAYTRRAAQATVIEDVRWRNVQDGSRSQSDPLYVDHRNGGQPNPPVPPNPPTPPVPPNPPETFGDGGGI